MNYKNLMILLCVSTCIFISFAGKEKRRKHLSAPTILRKDSDKYIDELLHFL